jgi:hypothetical protein
MECVKLGLPGKQGYSDEGWISVGYDQCVERVDGVCY